MMHLSLCGLQHQQETAAQTLVPKALQLCHCPVLPCLQHQQEAVAQTLAIMARTLQDNASLNFRPSIIAAAVLYCARRGQGQTPFWPVALVALTGYSATQSAELVAAITTVQRWASLDLRLVSDRYCMMWLSYQHAEQGLTLSFAEGCEKCRLCLAAPARLCKGCCVRVCVCVHMCVCCIRGHRCLQQSLRHQQTSSLLPAH